MAITFAAPATAKLGPTSAAIVLRASLAEAVTLTPGEQLLSELLDQIADRPGARTQDF